MKLKRQPDDFQVEELPTVTCGTYGRFVFYRLTKRGMGTLEALEAIRRRWNLPAARIHHGGLKDRHAVTVQYLSILEGPAHGLRETNLELEPLGLLPHPYGPAHFRGNRFTLVIRDLSREAAERAKTAIAQLPRDGLPNYFDDQRFGSVGKNGAFIGEAWLKGNHERALWLAIAEPNESDRPDARAEKEVLRELWNRWPEAKERLPRSHARSLVTYLVDHPTDYRGAFARVRRELRSLYFSAYQSYLWTLMLARLIERTTRPEQRTAVDFKVGTLPLHHGLDAVQAATLRAWQIPLPASRTPLPLKGWDASCCVEVLNPLGLTWEHLRVKHLKDVFFSKGHRPALFFARNLTHDLSNDELYAGRRKIALSFELPKGAYATLLVKRVTEIG